MRLLVLTNIPNPHNRFLWRALTDLGVDVEVCFEGAPSSIGRPWELELSEVEHHSSGLRHDIGHRRWKPDVVLVSGGYATPRQFSRLLAAASAFPAPIVWWGERISDRTGPASWVRSVFRTCDAVLAIGSWAVAGYRRHVRSGTPVHVFPYVTSSDLPEHAPDPEPVVGYAGRLIGWKNAELAVSSVAALPDDRRPRLEVVGDGPLRGRLEQQAADAGVDARFHGEVHPDLVASIRQRWWAQLVPSKEHDGWGLVVPEALAGGVPVLASELVGSAVDLVVPGWNGHRCSNPADWVDALAWALDPAAVAERSEAARAVGRAIDARHGAGFLLEILTQAIEGRKHERSFPAEALSGVIPC